MLLTEHTTTTHRALPSFAEPLPCSLFVPSLSSLLNYSWRVALGDDLTLTVAEFQALLETGRRVVKVKGRFVVLRKEQVEAVLKQLKTRVPVAKTTAALLRMSLAVRRQTKRAGALLQRCTPGRSHCHAWLVRQGNRLLVSDELHDRLTKALQVENVEVPPNLKATLREYQVRGEQVATAHVYDCSASPIARACRSAASNGASPT